MLKRKGRTKENKELRDFIKLEEELGVAPKKKGDPMQMSEGIGGGSSDEFVNFFNKWVKVVCRLINY